MRFAIFLCMSFVCSHVAFAAGEIEAFLVESKGFQKAQSKVMGHQSVDARFTDCERCESVSVEALDGERLTVRAEPEPRFSLTTGDLKHLLLAQNRDVFYPTDSYWLALAVPRDDQTAALKALHADYPYDRLLISLDGRPAAIDTVLTARNTGIQIGRFARRKELEAFAEQYAAEHGVEIEWADVEIERSLQNRRQLEERLGSGSSLR